jgi:hypothetical protein
MPRTHPPYGSRSRTSCPAKSTRVLELFPNVEQGAWATQLIERLVVPEGQDIVAVCILDTGVTQAHPLIAPVLNASDVQSYDPSWTAGDLHGHGTNMAGTSAYGDLMPLLATTGTVSLTHRLESVKILPDQGVNEPRLYGAIMAESIARAEIQAPLRKRAVCMAVTSDIGPNRGRPSSWSAAVDQLCFGDQTACRIILISAGNIRNDRVEKRLPSPERHRTD